MIKTLHEILKASPNMTYNEAVKVQKDMRVALEDEAAGFKTSTPPDVSGIDDLLKSDFNTATATGFKTSPGVCITAAVKKDIQQVKEIDYHRYWKDMYEKEHKLRQEAQGETTIVKGIGMSSPEMKEAKERIKELENSLSIALEINEEHQRYNGKLQTRVTDLEEDNKKISKQIQDQMDRTRRAGF